MTVYSKGTIGTYAYILLPFINFLQERHPHLLHGDFALDSSGTRTRKSLIDVLMHKNPARESIDFTQITPEIVGEYFLQRRTAEGELSPSLTAGSVTALRFFWRIHDLELPEEISQVIRNVSQTEGESEDVRSSPTPKKVTHRVKTSATSRSELPIFNYPSTAVTGHVRQLLSFLDYIQRQHPHLLREGFAMDTAVEKRTFDSLHAELRKRANPARDFFDFERVTPEIVTQYLQEEKEGKGAEFSHLGVSNVFKALRFFWAINGLELPGDISLAARTMPQGDEVEEDEEDEEERPRRKPQKRRQRAPPGGTLSKATLVNYSSALLPFINYVQRRHPQIFSGDFALDLNGNRTRISLVDALQNKYSAHTSFNFARITPDIVRQYMLERRRTSGGGPLSHSLIAGTVTALRYFWRLHDLELSDAIVDTIKGNVEYPPQNEDETEESSMEEEEEEEAAAAPLARRRASAMSSDRAMSSDQVDIVRPQDEDSITAVSQDGGLSIFDELQTLSRRLDSIAETTVNSFRGMMETINSLREVMTEFHVANGLPPHVPELPRRQRRLGTSTGRRRLSYAPRRESDVRNNL